MTTPRDGGDAQSSTASAHTSGLNRRGSRSAAMATFSMEVFDNEVVPSALNSIAPILRVATEIEHERPRVAYLCRFYAFEKAQNSVGRGVCRFKTALLQRIEKENCPSLAKRLKKSDAHEIGSFYQQYYENYVRALDKREQADRAQLGKAYQTAGVLFEVLSAVNKKQKFEIMNPEIMSFHREIQEKKDTYTPVNILPLDAASASQSIMQLDKIKASVKALQYTKGLTWPSAFEPERQKGGDLDLLDWLRAIFGFKRDSVRNQREHLILLLANVHIKLEPKPDPLSKLDDRAVDILMNKLFNKYVNWCKSLSRKHSLRNPPGAQPQEVQQRRILYLGLYLLIWGESADIRFMPMAQELHGLLAGNVSIVTGENIRPSYGGDEESFLRKVVIPICHAIRKEAEKDEYGKEPHSALCYYDNLNDYFWTSACFSLGWPMRDDGEFFKSVHESRRATPAGSSSPKGSDREKGWKGAQQKQPHVSDLSPILLLPGITMSAQAKDKCPLCMEMMDLTIDPLHVLVIQRKTVCILGIPSEFASEKVLRQKSFLGQYGVIENIIIDSTSRVLVTFSREEESEMCIELVNGYILDGRPLKAIFGVTRYCHMWLSNKVCQLPECTHLHQEALAEDICTKDDNSLSSSRLQHLLAMNRNGPEQLYGNTLPSPDFCNRTTICARNSKYKTCISDGVVQSSDEKNTGPLTAAVESYQSVDLEEVHLLIEDAIFEAEALISCAHQFDGAAFMNTMKIVDSVLAVFKTLNCDDNGDDGEMKAFIAQSLNDLLKGAFAHVRLLRVEVSDLADMYSVSSPTATEYEIKSRLGSIRQLLSLGTILSDFIIDLGHRPLREGSVLRSPIYGFKIVENFADSGQKTNYKYTDQKARGEDYSKDDCARDCSYSSDSPPCLDLKEVQLLLGNAIMEAEALISCSREFDGAAFMQSMKIVDSVLVIFETVNADKSDEAGEKKAFIAQVLNDVLKGAFAHVRLLRGEVSGLADKCSPSAPTATEKAIKSRLASIRQLLSLGSVVSAMITDLGQRPLREGSILRAPIYGFTI